MLVLNMEDVKEREKILYNRSIKSMDTKWHVIYYVLPSGEIPVRDFLDAAGSSLKAKAFRILLNIEEYGMQSVISHIKKLSGTPIWEIRILGGDSARILFVTEVNKQILLLHAFYKKTQKTPPKEIALALKRLDEHDVS
jgi:phage-related protein